MTFLLQIIMRFIWKWDSSVHNFIAHSQELLLAIFCWYKFVKECISAWATALLQLFSQISIGTVTTSTSVAAAFSVAHLFPSTWLHQTENIVQYDCDVSSWLCSVIKFNIMTQICLILLTVQGSHTDEEAQQMAGHSTTTFWYKPVYSNYNWD